MSDEFLWVEKYRPKIIDECILPNDLKSTFQEETPNALTPNKTGNRNTLRFIFLAI